MNFTSNRNILRWIIIAFAVFITSIILWNTYLFFQKLKESERKNMQEYFEDLEVEVKKRSVDKLLWNAISLKLDSISSRWRTEKIQEQYLPESTMEKFNEKLKSRNFENLEIIAAFKKDGKIIRKELLFSAAGALIQVREVKRIAYDFLLF